MELLKYTKKEQLIKDVIDELVQRYNVDEAYFLEFKHRDYKCLYHYGWEGDCRLRHKLFSEGIEHWCIIENAPFVTADILKDVRVLRSLASKAIPDGLISSKSVACVPVKGKYLIGTLTLIRGKSFSSEEVNALVKTARELSKDIDNLIKLRYTYMSSAFHDITERMLESKEENLPSQWRQQIEHAIRNVLAELGYSRELCEAFSFSIAIFKPSEELHGQLPCKLTDLSLVHRRCPAISIKATVSNEDKCMLASNGRYVCIPLIYKDMVLGVATLTFDPQKFWLGTAEDIITDREVLDDLAAFLRYYMATEFVPALHAMLLVDDFFIELEEKSAVRGRTAVDDILREASEFIYEQLDDIEALLAFKYIDGKEYLIYRRCSSKGAKNLEHWQDSEEAVVFDIPILSLTGEPLALIRIIEKYPNFKLSYHELLLIKRMTNLLKLSLANAIRIRNLEDENFALRRKERAELQRLRKELRKYKQSYIDIMDAIGRTETALKKSTFLTEIFTYMLKLSTERRDSIYQIFNKVVLGIPEHLSFQPRIILALSWVPLKASIDVVAYTGLSATILSNIKERLSSFVTLDETEELKSIIDFREPTILSRDSGIFRVFPELRRYRTVILVPIVSAGPATARNLQGILLIASRYRLVQEEIKEDMEYLAQLAEILGSFLDMHRRVRFSHKLEMGFSLITEYLNRFYTKDVIGNERSLYGYLNSMLDIVENVLQPSAILYAEYRGDDEFIIRLERGVAELEESLQSTIRLRRAFRVPKERLYTLRATATSTPQIMVPGVDPISLLEFGAVDEYLLNALRNNVGIPLKPKDELRGLLLLIFAERELTEPDFKLIAFLHQALNILLENFFLYQEINSYKDLLEATFSSISDGLIVLDLLRKVLLFNPNAKRILGLEGEIIGRDLLETFHSTYTNLYKDLEDISPLLRLYVNGEGDTLQLKEDKLELADGSELYIQYTISLIKDEEGYPKAYMLVLRDITRQKEMERERADMIALLSHDIRNPLTAVKSYISLLLRRGEKLSDDDKGRFLRIAKNELDRMARMLNNLIELVRLQSEGLRIRMERLNLCEIMRFYKESYDLLSLEHEFELVLPPEDVYVMADKEMVQHVLDNLISNAVKYSPNGGLITIGVLLPGKEFMENLKRYGLEGSEDKVGPQQVVVFVKDRGIGIPRAEIGKLFQRYYRVHSGSTSRIRGTGLGLYITRRLVESQGGRIWVVSEEGKGSTFAFTLNLATDPLESPDREGKRMLSSKS